MSIDFRLQFFADGGDDKTEEPTGKKLEDARKEGQVAKSKEITSCVSLLVLFVILKFWAVRMGGQFMDTFGYVYNRIPDTVYFWHGEMPVRETRSMFVWACGRILLILLPILALAVIIAFVCELVQVKWKVSTKPLQPKLSKFNPINGFKRIFSANSVVELIKSILKIGLILWISYNYIKDKSMVLLTFFDMPFLQAIGEIGTLVTDLGLRIAAIYVIIAASDFAYQKWKFHKDMKMTKQEVKDEYKQAEGDPEVKGKIKQKMMEASRRRMMQQLPQADVVITNPTHYAVAIKYEPEVREAPYVVAKGSDYLARKIKEIARENGVEIYENKPLARMLYANVEIGELVPPELYQAVAEVLAFVYQIQGKI